LFEGKREGFPKKDILFLDGYKKMFFLASPKRVVLPVLTYKKGRKINYIIWFYEKIFFYRKNQ